MRKKCLYSVLLSLLSFCMAIGAIPDSLIYNLDFGNFNDNSVMVSKNGKRKTTLLHLPEWVFFNTDSPELKNLNLQDTGYTTFYNNNKKGLNFSFGGESDFIDENYKGKGWYKCYFRVPYSQINKIYGLYISLHGAAEVFIDGKLEKNIGKINEKGISVTELNVSGVPINFYISDTSVHCIAIRFVFSNYAELIKKYPSGVENPAFEFTDPTLSSENNSALSVFYSITNMLSAFFFALFLIHLLIYLFYREKSFNLLYSFFLFLLSLSFLEAYMLQYIEDLKLYLWVSNADSIIFPSVCFLLVTLLNKLLNEKSSWHYKTFSVMLVLLVIDVFFVHRLGNTLSVTIVFYTYFNTLAHSIKGIRRKVASARFLGWGILGFTLSFILLIFSTIIITMIGVGSNQETWAISIYAVLIILAVLSIPLSMTAYLAFDFARTNSSLSSQLKQNQELSEKTIIQEKEKQELLKNQNLMLETQVQERTKEIAEQNQQLEHQKKEITDSINYAKRIQQALLPELSEIKAKLPNSFVFYLPKDIVSGDFYFFQTISGGIEHPGRKNQTEESGVYIAAADCTGHGVPGALMSMIVHEKLESATKIFSEPKDILKSINKQVKDALKQYQSESASRDGCDIAFLKIVGKQISYSGAFRPIYLFDKEGKLSEIKATKTAIAGLTPYEQEFIQTEINTSELKAVYIFSDGFADQFGGSKSKKLTTKKFKELLSSIVNLPVESQHAELERFFIDWKGNVEQIDDVLVIGLTF